MVTYSVLMVCTGNICRSPMAEGLLRQLMPSHLKAAVSVRSAGTHGLHGNRAEPFAVRAAAVYGADIGDHRARVLDARMIKSADLVLAMEHAHLDWINGLLFLRCKYADLLGVYTNLQEDPEISDPYGLSYDAYETCAAAIVDCMPNLIDHIRRQIEQQSS